MVLYLRWVLLIPFFILLSTVLVVDEELANGVVSGKYFWFYFSIELAGFSVLISYIIKHENTRFTILDLLILTFCIVNLSVSYYHNHEVNNKSALLTLLTVLYFYFKLFFAQYRWTVYPLTLFFIFTGLIEAVWGLMQLYSLTSSQHNLFKTTGSFFNPGPYAGYLALVMPYAFYYLLNDYRCFKAKFHKKYLPFYFRWALSALTVLVIILILPATWSRGAWIASLCACLLVTYFYIFNKKKVRYKMFAYYGRHKKRVIITLLFVSLILLTVFAGVYFLKKESADGRLLVWKISLQVLNEHPTGVGLGNFSGSYGEKQAKYFTCGKALKREEFIAGSPEYAFNEYLQIAVESGFVTLILFLYIAGYTIFIGIRKRRYAPLGALAALLVFAAISYPFNVLPFDIILVFLIALCTVENKNINRKCTGKRCKLSVFVILLFLLFGGLVIYSRYPMYNAYKKWNEAGVLYKDNYYKEVVLEYEKIFSHLAHETRFLFEYAQALSKSGKFEASNRVLHRALRISCDPMLHCIMGKNHQALRNFEAAEQSFLMAAHVVPNRLYPYYLLGKLYHEMNMPEKTCEMSAYIHSKQAKVHSKAVEEINEEMKRLCNDFR